MRELLLVLHLGGAAILGVLGVVAVAGVVTKKKQTYKMLASSIGIGGGVQLVTGSLLALFTQGTLLAFCARIGIYLTAVAVIETMLFIAMRKNNLIFPTRQVAPALSLGILVAVLTASTMLY